ncbi:sulfatase domain-containing protein [Noviherbaspirillum denitrificans]|uniref:Sulfatase domain-containing protein n=2 Tax=Noviherbaspirillum denitrificans TaxID=1968433 RepID=A0A254T6N4_9BURK|nr:phosphoethanolamine transferase [Noviherbaspirillum denitrificans]OWW18255.1 sulfatase domain-containing protein [Noviherbaspirillum denitrificans]
MRALLRPPALFVVLTYLLLSAVPFLPLLFGRPVETAGQVLAIEFVAWLAIWAAFARPAWFHWLLLPAFVLVPVELYLQAYFNQGISAHHLGIIAETSPKESMEFLGYKVWLLAGALLASLFWWAWSWRAACRAPELNWGDDSRWITIALLSCALGTWMYEDRFGLEKAKASAPTARKSSALPPLPAWAEVPFDAKAFARSWPFGLSVRGQEFWKERRYLAELAQRSGAFSFGAQQAQAIELPQTVVMVIGESSRYDRWSLNGYKRETNPLLKKEANLVSLSNVVTAVSATRLSVPVLVSRKPARMSLQAGFAEKSFLTAFKEAGFKTWWLSNQMTFGQFDTPVSVFAQEADVTQFLNLGGFSTHASFDDILLAPLQAAMADASPKKLIVLHTLGNHWNYSHRHPKDFDKWQPSLFGVASPDYNNRAIKEPLNNSYDNSILYTDWFLSEVIARLKSSSHMALMMYVSDHGQTLYDGNCGYAFHGHNTQFEFHVPALVWYSDLYRATHPAKVNQLIRNKRAKLATENVFHSLVDMADIRYDGEQLERSFVSREFKQHKRYVDSYGWTDYDNATFKGDCREVIDRGTPLKQDK